MAHENGLDGVLLALVGSGQRRRRGAVTDGWTLRSSQVGRIERPTGLASYRALGGADRVVAIEHALRFPAADVGFRRRRQAPPSPEPTGVATDRVIGFRGAGLGADGGARTPRRLYRES